MDPGNWNEGVTKMRKGELKNDGPANLKLSTGRNAR